MGDNRSQVYHVCSRAGSHGALSQHYNTLAENSSSWQEISLDTSTMHLASGVTERAVKLEWRIVDLAKLVGQGSRRSKTCRSFTYLYLVRWVLLLLLLLLTKKTTTTSTIQKTGGMALKVFPAVVEIVD